MPLINLAQEGLKAFVENYQKPELTEPETST
jgi:hypothetical protein